MTLWSTATLKSAIVPGGIILAIASLFIQQSWVTLSPSALTFTYYAVFVAALSLSLRFRSLRVVCSSVVLLLANYALTTKGPALHAGAGRMAFAVVAILVPLDFILLTFVPERTFRREHFIGIVAVLFFQSTFVAVFSRPDQPEWSLLHFSLIRASHLHLPQPALLMFLVSLGLLLSRVLRFRKAIDHGMFWSLLTVCIALESGATSKPGVAYFAVSGLILASCMVENSYSLAYRDELTGLRSRRAFNDAVAFLKQPYAIAAVDIDHFKSINDTYGHDSGDQVLRLVASRLAEVSGGGESYRVGGEEFTILFPGRNAQEVFAHLELLRMNIESCSFRLRREDDRRKAPRDFDRRAAESKSKAKPKVPPRTTSSALSVTVSIGIAESRTSARIEEIIELADAALYTAKQGGRNRIEVATAGKGRRRNKSAKPAKT